MVVRIGLTAVFVLGFLPAVSAGPVTWSYTARVETADGGSFAHFGIETEHWFIPPQFPGDLGQEGQTDYHIVADIGGGVSGQAVGSRSFSPAAGAGGIHVGSVGRGDLHSYSMDDDWASQLPTDYWLRVRIVDDSSGEERDLSYRMHGSSSGFFLPTGTGVVNASIEDRTDTFILGENHFVVRPRIRRSESAEHTEMDVLVGNLTTTPEPGTLALASLGLLGFGAARARRWASRAVMRR